MTARDDSDPWDKRRRELADLLDDAEMFRDAVEMLEVLSAEPLDDRLMGVNQGELAQWIAALERTVANLRARINLQDE